MGPSLSFCMTVYLGDFEYFRVMMQLDIGISKQNNATVF